MRKHLRQSAIVGQALKDRQQQQRKAPKVVELFDEKTGLPFKATFNQETGDFDRVGGTKAPSGMLVQTNPDGTMTFQQGTGIKPMKESEAKANIYASRAENSNLILERLESQGTDLSQKLASGVPIVGNYALDPEYRQYDQGKGFNLRENYNRLMDHQLGISRLGECFGN